MGSRYLDPALARWIQPDSIVPDPTNPQMLNRYSYVGNTPIVYTDPTGHIRICNAKCEHDEDKQWSLALPPVPVIPLKFNPDSSFNPQETWKNLSPLEAITRTILSEEGRKTTDSVKRVDAVGVAWVIKNRTTAVLSIEHFDNAYHSALGAVLADGQFLGMINKGQAAVAADPENNNGAFGSGLYAGRKAYWEARAIAQGVLDGTIPDPTRGATSYNDAEYVPDGRGGYKKNDNGDYETRPYPDDRTRFSSISYYNLSIPQLWAGYPNILAAFSMNSY